MTDTPTRCGYAVIIGAPNAGKSTLLNKLAGAKLSIVSAKPQTTRGRLRGIVMEGDTQIVVVDTPGIFEARPEFEQAMVDAAWSGADEADAVILLVDANRGLDDDTKRIVGRLKNARVPVALVLNKIDKVDKPLLPQLAQALYALHDFDRSFMICASRGDGVRDLRQYLAARMPEAPFLYPDDQATDASERELAAEVTREECFLKLHAELPYGLMVETEKWEEGQVKGRRSVRIHQVVIIERESHKKIILGKEGVMLKAIGSAARRKICNLLDVEAHLFLFVKVRADWKKDPASFRAAGLDCKR